MESKPVGTQSKIQKLHSVVFRFIAGKKADKKYIRILSHGVMIYLILLFESENIFPNYSYENFIWDSVNIALMLVGVKVVILWIVS